MKNKQKVKSMVFWTFAVFGLYVALQLFCDSSGITRAYHQWWTSWSGINFTGMVEIMYRSTLYRVCAWMLAICGSMYLGSFISDVIDGPDGENL